MVKVKKVVAVVDAASTLPPITPQTTTPGSKRIKKANRRRSSVFNFIKRKPRSYLREIVIRTTETTSTTSNNNDGDDDEVNNKLNVTLIYPCDVSVLKMKLQSTCSVRSEDQRLYYKGSILDDSDDVPEECFSDVKSLNKKGGVAADEEEEFVFYIWMVDVGFEGDKYAMLQKNYRGKGEGNEIVNGGAAAAVVDVDDTDVVVDDKKPETDKLPLESPMNNNNTASTQMIQKQITPAKKESETPGSTEDKTHPHSHHHHSHDHDHFHLHKELSLINCESHAAALTSLGFTSKGSFSYLTETHLTTHPLHVPSKQRSKILALSSAYQRQMQYDAQVDDKNHLHRVNELEFKLKYTIDNVTFFASRNEMDKFYSTVKKEGDKSSVEERKQKIRDKFNTVKKVTNFIIPNEKQAKAHTDDVLEKIMKITDYNAKDEFGIPKRNYIHSGHVSALFTSQKNIKDKFINTSKVEVLLRTMRDKFSSADVFNTGNVPVSTLKVILLHTLESAHVHEHDVGECVEVILNAADVEGDGVHYDNEVVIQTAADVILEHLDKHTRGEGRMSHKLASKECQEKNKIEMFWGKKSETKVIEEKVKDLAMNEITIYNCPVFTGQTFNNRVCTLCKCDRSLHVLIHTKSDYIKFEEMKNSHRLNLEAAAAEREEVVFRKEEVKRRLRARTVKIGNGEIDWEHVDFKTKKKKEGRHHHQHQHDDDSDDDDDGEEYEG